MPRKVSVKSKKVNDDDENEYACVGGNPKMRREMKRHKDMVKKFGKERTMMDKD